MSEKFCSETKKKTKVGNKQTNKQTNQDVYSNLVIYEIMLLKKS